MVYYTAPNVERQHGANWPAWGVPYRKETSTQLNLESVQALYHGILPHTAAYRSVPKRNDLY